jgi:hypothetical protein
MSAPRSAALVGLQTRAESSNGLPRAQPATAAETPGNTMKSTNRGAPFAWKISGPHTSAENAVPAAPNPSAADVRGHRLKNLVT